MTNSVGNYHNNCPQKTAVLVAQRIIRNAIRSGLEVGGSLPLEKTMLKMYDTGRGTLREALRLLEFQGVIALKPGPGGGPVLLDPDASHLARPTRAAAAQISVCGPVAP